MQKIFGLLEKAGFPNGVGNLVNGAKEAVDALLDQPAVEAISFAGSTPVAKYVYSRGSANGKRVQVQGGAKNPIIVLPDADMEMITQIAADSAKHLARPNSKVLTIFGAGNLGRTHLLSFNELFDLDQVRVVDLFPKVAERFAAEMAEETGLPVTVPPSAEAAVRDADLIVTVNTGSAVNVELPWLKPGAFIARLGSYQEVALDLLLEVGKLIVNRRDYGSYRVPEIIELVRVGKLAKEDIHAEWPNIVAGRSPGRESQDEIILYIALGIWGKYAAILPAVYRRAKELGLGTNLGS